MRRFVKLAVLGLLLSPIVGLFTACSEESDCSMSMRPMMQCYLYKLDANQVVVKDTLDSLTITAMGTDSVILNRQKKVHTLSLPLRYTADSTVLVFHYSRTNRDTITIRQTNTPYFLSMECGYQMKQAINGVKHSRNKLDSIYILNNEAGIYGQENLKLFY